jgi:hypothetical protein
MPDFGRDFGCVSQGSPANMCRREKFTRSAAAAGSQKNRIKVKPSPRIAVAAIISNIKEDYEIIYSY